jgi:peptidoglycan hydrolase-like protein with peptidoglycan-binding domain
MAFIGGLFTAGLALGAGESQWGSSSQMEKEQKQQQQYGGAAQQGQQRQMAGQQPDKQQVQELQKKLNEEGFNAGPVDGIIGPKTRSALQQFQREEGLAASGQPDQQTLEALDIEHEEFFGVSPEFGEEQQKKQTEEQQREQQQQEQPYQQQQQQRPGSMETR